MDRPNAKEHLAFGRGPHACPGGPLARAETRISIERLLARMADIRISEAAHGPAEERHYDAASAVSRLGNKGNSCPAVLAAVGPASAGVSNAMPPSRMARNDSTWSSPQRADGRANQGSQRFGSESNGPLLRRGRRLHRRGGRNGSFTEATLQTSTPRLRLRGRHSR